MLENETNGSNIAVIERPHGKQPTEVSRMIRQRECVTIIDVRSGLEYDMGHIQGAVSLPRGTWCCCEFLDKDEMNVIYGNAAETGTANEAAEKFAAKGYRVIVMEGGFEAWLASGLPLAAR